MLLFVLASLVFISQYFYSQAGRLNASLHFSPSFLAFGVAFHLCYWLANVFCWQKIVAWYANTHISLIQSLGHIVIITLGKYFPGKVWGMIARASLMKQEGVPLHHSVNATFYEQYLVLHASGLVCAAILYTLTPSAYTFALACIAIASIALIVPLQRIVFAVLAHIMSTFKPKEIVSVTQLSYWQMIKLLTGYSLNWISLGLILSCIYFSLFNKAPSLEVIMRLTFANTIGITLGFFALFSPGGLGVREAVTSVLLTSLLPLEDGLMLSLVFRLWIVISEILSSLVLLIPKRHKEHTIN